MTGMRDLDKPVHLYVKKHNLTGLKYFGRTTENPHVYQGSGAYWTRHVAKYGNDVSTRVIGTYTDSTELRAAAEAFSVEKKIVSSTKWANLLGEDGGVSGDGWSPHRDHRRQIEALDAAVERRLQEAAHIRQSAPIGQSASTRAPAVTSSDSKRNPLVWVLVAAGIVGALWFFNNAGRSSSLAQQPAAESCTDWLSAAAKTTRADKWVEPSASEFMDDFSARCETEYGIWVDWQSIWTDAASSGSHKCSYWTQFRIEPEAIELARQDGSCRG